MMRAFTLIMAAALLTACGGGTSMEVWRGSEVVRVCPDGAVILAYQGRLYRVVGGFPKPYHPAVSLKRTCAGDDEKGLDSRPRAWQS